MKMTMVKLHSRFFAFASLMLFAALVQAATPSGWWIDIVNDRAAKIERALQQGADPNVVSPEGQPSIMLAIRNGAWKTYDVLLADRRIAVNAINKDRETPLMYLAVLGDTERARALIRRGAQVNRLGWTPLQYAASTGRLETVKMLVGQKAIINAPGPDGTTALMMAARAGAEDVVAYLLDQGADVTMQNLQKMDAADWARLKKHDKLARRLDDLSARVAARRAQERRTAIQSGTYGAEADTAADGSPAYSGAGDATGYSGTGAGQGYFGANGLSGDPGASMQVPGTEAAPSAGWQPAGQPPAQGARPAAQAPAQAAPQPSGTSRYFDLKRFDKPAEP